MKPLHLFLALIIMIVWGVNFTVAKLGLTEMPPLMLIGLRFALVAALLVPFTPYPRGKMRQIIGLSVVLGTIHFGLMFTGIKGVDAAVAAIAIQLQVPFAALLAAVLFKDKLGWRRLGAMVLAFAGIALIAGEPRMQSSLISLGFVIAASLVWAVSNIQVKYIGEVNSLSLTGWMALFAAPQLLFWSYVFEDGQAQVLAEAGLRGWGAMIYMAVAVSVVGYGLWYYLVPRYSMNQTMPFTLLVPLFGVLSGVVFLDEMLTWPMVFGSAMTLGGVAIIVLRRPTVSRPETG